MAQSIRNRFNGNKQEVLDFIATYGIFKGMTKYDVKDYVALKNWITEETGNENFGIRPKLDSYPGEDAFDKLAGALIRVITEVQADNKRLMNENRILKEALQLRCGEDNEKALFALEAVASL